jgi:uncharacterized alpha-E superfamily protein
MKNRRFYHGFWMQRYLTRALIEARILKIQQKFHLDHPKTEKYISVDKDAFVANIKKSRDNCHLVRDVICDEAWIQLNELWLWVSSGETEKTYDKSPEIFYDTILNHGLLIEEYFEEMLRKDEFFHALRIGKGLEKLALQIDVLSQFSQQKDTQEHSILVLEFFYAKDSFCKLHGHHLNAKQVLKYLMEDSLFPNSLKEEISTLEASLQSLGISYPLSPISPLDSLQQKIQGLGTYLSVEYFQEQTL